MKVALVYDHVNKIGGAERILILLHEIYPEAPLYTAVYNKSDAQWASVFKVTPSFMQYLPFAKSNHEFYPCLPIFAFEHFRFDSYDVIISVTSAEAKCIITSPNTLHICYLLTPTRFIWTHFTDYFKNPYLKTLGLPFVSAMRIWDQFVSRRPDKYVAISQTVAKRIEKYYNISPLIVYPGVDADSYRPLNMQKKSGKYFLIVSRLVSYKRIDIAIEACNALQIPLVIIGKGKDYNALHSRAGRTILFVHSLTDDELISYYQNCRALIFPQEEDFGLTAVEALACGKPVIAFRSGGALEIISEGLTGEFFSPQTAEALIEVLKHFDEKKYAASACRNRSLRFSKNLFVKEFSQLVKEEWNRFKDSLYI